MKSASAPPRGEPGKLAVIYQYSISTVVANCQSKLRDVHTAAQRRRCGVVVAGRIFMQEGEVPEEVQKQRP